MIKKLFTTILLSTVTIMALESGNTIPEKLQEKLNMKADKVYILDFFASWCKSCKQELPLISNVYNNKIAEVIGINTNSQKEDGEKFVADLALPFPIIYDQNKSLVESFEPLGFPALYFVKNNKIIEVVFGAVDEIDKKIEEEIKEIK